MRRAARVFALAAALAVLAGTASAQVTPMGASPVAASAATAASLAAPPEAPPAAAATDAPPPGFVLVEPLGEVATVRPVITFRPAASDFTLVQMTLDGVIVTQLVSANGGIWRFEPFVEISGGAHTVDVVYTALGVSSAVAWTFHTSAPPPHPESAFGWSFGAEIARTHGEPVGREGPTTNGTTITGVPHLEGSVTDNVSGVQTAFNGTLAQNVDPSALPQHVTPPAVVVTAKAGAVSGALGNGPVETFAPSPLLQTVSTRRGIELGLDTKLVSMRAFGNFEDGLPASTGVNEFRQTLYGVAVMPKLGTDRLKVRVLYQYVEDEKDPLFVTPPALSPPYGEAGAAGTAQTQPAFYGSAPKKGQLLSFSADLLLEPTSNLTLRGEAVRSEFTSDRTSSPLQTDWAYAILLTANPLGFSFAGGVRLIGDNFGAPANPALIAGRKVYDGSISRSFGALSLSANYAHTGDSGGAGSGTTGFTTPTGRADAGALTASYSFAATRTSVSASLQENKAESAGSTNRSTNLNLSAAQPLGEFQFSLGLLGGRQETDGLSTSQAETRGATFGLSRQGNVFSVQTSAGVNQSENRLTGDVTTSLNVAITPDVALFNRMVNITPLGSWTRQTATGGLSDSSSWSWGGRLTVRTWGKIRGFALWAQYLESAMAPHAEDQAITRDRRFGAGLAVLFGGGSLAPSVAQQTITPQLGLR
ncbi:MAG: hypothetical protein IPL89_06275 [Acidobacteria bacterium]|nr:hypothetical protein [Acidobacteriota bacterium]